MNNPAPATALRTALAALLLFLAVLLAYQPAFPGCFIWDDDSQLLENALIHDPDGLRRIWFSTEPLEYYPLYYTSLRLQWHWFGPHPAGYLSVNLALHGLNAILLMFLLRRLRGPIPLLAAALFALHPVNVFSVAWINQHKTVLSTTFYLASLLCFARSARQSSADRAAELQPTPFACSSGAPPPEDLPGQASGWLALAFVFFVTGLLTKPTLILLPVFMALAGSLIYRRRGWTLWAPLAPFFALALAAGLLRVVWHPPPLADALEPPRIDGWGAHLIVPGRAVWFYLTRLLWPRGLMIVYPKWALSSAAAISYLPSLLGLAALVVLWRTRNRWPAGFLGYSFFLLGLFPVLGFFDNQYFTFSYVANHWLYAPMMGMAALAAILIGSGHSSRTAWARYFITLLLLLGLLLLARGEASRFRDPFDYYERGVAENPDNVVAHQNLANLYREAGHPDQALPHYLEAVRIHPTFWKARNDAAAMLIETGAFPEAMEQLQASLKIFPENPEAHFRLGTLLGQLGQNEAAIRHLQEAVGLNPADPVAFGNLGIAYFNVGRLDMAEACFREALQLKPDYDAARRNLGLVLQQQAPSQTR